MNKSAEGDVCPCSLTSTEERAAPSTPPIPTYSPKFLQGADAGGVITLLL